MLGSVNCGESRLVHGAASYPRRSTVRCLDRQRRFDGNARAAAVDNTVGHGPACFVEAVQDDTDPVIGQAPTRDGCIKFGGCPL